MKDLTYIDTERLKRLKLPSLARRRRSGDMIQTFKIHVVNGLFKFCKQSSTRGHSLKLEKPRCRTTTRQQHFSQRVINDWNSLPERVVAAKDVNAFKTRIDQHWNHEVVYEY